VNDISSSTERLPSLLSSKGPGSFSEPSRGLPLPTPANFSHHLITSRSLIDPLISQAFLPPFSFFRWCFLIFCLNLPVLELPFILISVLNDGLCCLGFFLDRLSIWFTCLCNRVLVLAFSIPLSPDISSFSSLTVLSWHFYPAPSAVCFLPLMEALTQ